ncbi:MAG: beta-galactosidase [Pseudonocardia sp.]|nr:beta-galactosidase [Pseudonocardia sp.]
MTTRFVRQRDPLGELTRRLGRPAVLGEYPYYRVRPERWEANLLAARTAGVDVITAYIPWRHHETTGGGFDFTGFSDPQRDVVQFLRLVAAADLFLIAKPGPFVHAELQLGGLPDRVVPTPTNGFIPARTLAGTTVSSQGQPLPSPWDPRFRRHYREWLAVLSEHVLRERLYPTGPIIAIQVGNEGVYSEANQPLGAFGAEEPARRLTAASPRAATDSDTGDLDGARGAREATLINDALADIAAALATSAPLLSNLPLPERGYQPGRAVDAWLARVPFIGPPRGAVGYTSWVGTPHTDEDTLIRYWLGARLLGGDCLEDNWGHIWDDTAYLDPRTTWSHALLGLALGSRTCSLYTACATSHWSPQLDLDPTALRAAGRDPAAFAPPYCPGAPLRENGTTGPTFPALCALRRLLEEHGPALLSSQLRPDVTLLVDPNLERGALTAAARVCGYLMTRHGLTCDISPECGDPPPEVEGLALIVPTAHSLERWRDWARGRSGLTVWLTDHAPPGALARHRPDPRDSPALQRVAADLAPHATGTASSSWPTGLVSIRRRTSAEVGYEFLFNQTASTTTVPHAGQGLSTEQLPYLTPGAAVVVRTDHSGRHLAGALDDHPTLNTELTTGRWR